MRKLLFWFVIFIPAVAFAQKAEKFFVKGQIKGLAAGDTLRFQSVNQPGYKLAPGFVVIAGKDGKFAYSGIQPHTTLYIMDILPVDGKKMPSVDRRGEELLIRNGDKLIIRGERQFWAFCKIAGGVYDNPFLKRSMEIRDSLGIIRSGYSQQIDLAREKKDTKAVSKYTDLFNEFRLSSVEADSLDKIYYALPGTSELAAIEILGSSSYRPVQEIKAAYEALPEAVKNSYHGKLLEARTAKLLSLEAGRLAPDFTLTNADGSVSLADFKGRYLLIYHWGHCPGSMQVDPEVRDFYDAADKSKIAILGVTEYRSDVEALNKMVSAFDTILGMNVKDRTNCMLTHHYPDYDMTLEGNNPDEIFIFGGLPYFVLIDPEGRMVDRGFHAVFYKIRDILTKK